MKYEYLYYFIDELTPKRLANQSLIRNKLIRLNWPRPTEEDYKYFDLKDNISQPKPETYVSFMDLISRIYFLRRTYLQFRVYEKI